MTSTGIISVIIQLFAVDRIVRRFGESAVLSIFLGVVAVGFLLSIFASTYVMFFGVTLIIFLCYLYIETCFDDAYFKVSGK